MPYTPDNNPYIPGDPYSYDLKWMVNDIKHMEERFGELDSQVQEATDQADISEGFAVGEQDGDPVGSDSPYYENNSKYFSQKSEQSADDSEGFSLVSEGFANGEQDGVPVASGSPYYENSAKYYAQEAAASEQAAKDYADNIADPVSGLVTNWLNTHVDPDSGYVIDTSLTIATAAADAKVVGDNFRDLFDKYNLMLHADLRSSGYTTLAADFKTGKKYYIQVLWRDINYTEQIMLIKNGVSTSLIPDVSAPGIYEFTSADDYDGIRSALIDFIVFSEDAAYMYNIQNLLKFRNIDYTYYADFGNSYEDKAVILSANTSYYVVIKNLTSSNNQIIFKSDISTIVDTVSLEADCSFIYTPNVDIEFLRTAKVSVAIFKYDEFVKEYALPIVATGKISLQNYYNVPVDFVAGTVYTIKVTAVSGNDNIRIYDSSNNVLRSIQVTKPGVYYYYAENSLTGSYIRSVFLEYEVYEGAIGDITLTVGSSNSDFAQFTDACKFAYSRGNVTLNLAAETFDLISETDISTEGSGLDIGNNMHIIGQAGTVISAIYTMGDPNVEEDFSIFNAMHPTDFIIENVKLIGKNIRYCVHDDCQNTAAAYKHTYKNCDMYIDNDASSWRNSSCIGAGFGTDGTVTIEGGIYESVRLSSGQPEEIRCLPISYHRNPADQNAHNRLIITGVYLRGTGCRIWLSGGNQSTYIINNCSYEDTPYIATPGAGMDLVFFNNEIRA